MCSRAVPPVKSVSRTALASAAASRRAARRAPRASSCRSRPWARAKRSARGDASRGARAPVGACPPRARRALEPPPGFGETALRDQSAVADRVDLLREQLAANGERVLAFRHWSRALEVAVGLAGALAMAGPGRQRRELFAVGLDGFSLCSQCVCHPHSPAERSKAGTGSNGRGRFAKRPSHRDSPKAGLLARMWYRGYKQHHIGAVKGV